MRLAKDIQGNKFSEQIILADNDQLSTYLLAIVLAAYQSLSSDSFNIFMSYYGIGIDELSVEEIARKFNKTPFDVATIIEDFCSEFRNG